ncbi:hypothetical protein J5Y09_14995 [Roseomonas sp. PWR1]|uniref:HEAT repeat domain-containing protein n=1 Tax=Roseomonas nitratireducens TaxID=2820810 RepID=A0ABS4AV32_9PROT|nr:hypothetical protein [Neoroseomonas nitratireducens]MBP0465230.1 hypothetical protein [Neoroseomonas nitratireducens]
MSAHEEAPSPITEALAALLVLVVAILEGWILVRAVADPTAIPAALQLHGLIALGTLLAAYGLRRAGGDDPAFLLFVVAAVFLGPLGVAGAAVAALLRRLFVLRARPFAEWYVALFPEERQDRTREIYERVVLRGHGPAERSTVAPFADVIALGSLQEKQAAIALIASGFRPEFANALRAALNDQEAAVRVQAAAAVARIEQQFLQRSMTLDARRSADPDNRDLIMEAARHHEALSATGLIDETRARESAEDALALYLDAVARTPAGPARTDATAAAGRLLLRLGRAEEAVRLLAPAAEEDQASPSLVAAYLEGLFRLHRYVDLREFCLRLREAGAARLPDQVEEALSLWTEDASQPMLPAKAA